MVYILGIHEVHPHHHYPTAVLIKDGKIVAIGEKERLVRIKDVIGFSKLKPDQRNEKDIIDFCLDYAGIGIEDVDYIAHSFSWNMNVHDNPNKNYRFSRYLKNKPPIVQKIGNHFYIPHHLAHAASCFRASGFEDSNILCVDLLGERETYSCFYGKENKIDKVSEILRVKNSIGSVYDNVSNKILGLEEGKTMALAAYGKPTFDFSNILNVSSSSNFSINPKKVLDELSCLVRKGKEEIKSEHKNLAASLQQALEKSMINLAKEAYEHSKNDNFCLAGGVALNCSMNGRIARQEFIKNIFVTPMAHDGGSALGAALETYALLGYKCKFKMEHTYYGPEYSDEEIKRELDSQKIGYSYHSDIAGIAAELIAKGNIIGWFQGRMECGPRALGNRSILANPSDKQMSLEVNKRKGREIWRPFGPSIIEERASEWFENARKSPFMTIAFQVKKDRIKEIPAAVHIDGTSRPQTVNKGVNEKYYKLIKEFENLTSIPLILNTSFNHASEPIVCSPKDAINSFLKMKLDYLAIGNYVAAGKK